MSSDRATEHGDCVKDVTWLDDPERNKRVWIITYLDGSSREFYDHDAVYHELYQFERHTIHRRNCNG